MLIVICGCGNKEDHSEIKIKKVELSSKEGSADNFNKKKHEENESLPLQTIPSKEAKDHIGDSVNVTGFVADVYLSDKVAYLNFGNKFPKNEFTCAIFSSKFPEFSDLTSYKGKFVTVTGKISIFKNKPQMILELPAQIKITKQNSN